MSSLKRRVLSRQKRLSVAGCAAFALAVAVFAGAQTPKPQPAATKAQATAADSQVAAASAKSKEWPDYAGAPEGNRYMPLNQITKENVTKLEVAWNYPYAETGFNPIVAHGIIYTKARNKSVVAVDAATGKELWVHDGLTGMTERGMNYWESKDGKDRRIIFCLADYMQELDATTGKLIRSIGNNGAVDLRQELMRDPNTIRVQSGTPGKVFEDLIIFGSAVGEGYFSAPGDLRAYNILTGKLAWQFHTIPHPGEPGYETWPKDAWKYIGGVNDWGEISVDSARGIAYFPLGSPTFDFFGADRVGNGLYGTSLVALNARTGKLIWHFQTVHHDLWDYDNVAAPQLTTIMHDGKKIDVVAMAGKTGYMYVFDRVTGQPIWPIPETPVPHESNVPGEVVSPTQPIPTAPPPFTSHSFTAADVNPFILTDQQRADLIDRISKSRFQGPFTPIGFDPVIHMPGNQGGANWGSTSANPNDGTVYVIGYNYPTLMRLLPAGEARGGRGGGGGGGGGGGRGAAATPALYTQNCMSCHGANRQGGGAAPSLVGIAAKLKPEEMRATISEGKNTMPAFHQLNGADLDTLVTYLTTADAAGGRGGGGRGGPVLSFPPVTPVETGPVTTRPPLPPGTVGMQDYPDAVPHPDERLTMDGYGVEIQANKPPYTSLTAYDLNKGTIKWQIGIGDDYRVVKQYGIHGTGASETMKGSSIITSTGLVFVNAADRKIHIYDADNGKELNQLPLGAVPSGSDSMYELNGKQYLLVTSSPVGTRMGGDDKAADPATTGPTGLVAYAIKQ